MERHSRAPGRLAEAVAEPARTLSSWQGAGELAAIPQPPRRAGDLALAPRSARQRGAGSKARERKGALPSSVGGEKMGKRD